MGHCSDGGPWNSPRRLLPGSRLWPPKFLQTGAGGVTRYALVLGDGAEDRTERSEPEGDPIWRSMIGMSFRRRLSFSPHKPASGSPTSENRVKRRLAKKPRAESLRAFLPLVHLMRRHRFRCHMDQGAGIRVFQHPQRAIGTLFHIANALAHIPALQSCAAASNWWAATRS